MFAGMVDGKVDTADLFFFFAVILAVVAAVLYMLATRPTPTDRRVTVAVWAPVAGWLAVASAAVGFWVL